MLLDIPTEHLQVLREVLSSALRQLRTESARADSRDYREYLHHRERVIEDTLAELEPRPFHASV